MSRMAMQNQDPWKATSQIFRDSSRSAPCGLFRFSRSCPSSSRSPRASKTAPSPTCPRAPTWWNWCGTTSLPRLRSGGQTNANSNTTEWPSGNIGKGLIWSRAPVHVWREFNFALMNSCLSRKPLILLYIFDHMKAYFLVDYRNSAQIHKAFGCWKDGLLGRFSSTASRRVHDAKKWSHFIINFSIVLAVVVRWKRMTVLKCRAHFTLLTFHVPLDVSVRNATGSTMDSVQNWKCDRNWNSIRAFHSCFYFEQNRETGRERKFQRGCPLWHAGG